MSSPVFAREVEGQARSDLESPLLGSTGSQEDPVVDNGLRTVTWGHLNASFHTVLAPTPESDSGSVIVDPPIPTGIERFMPTHRLSPKTWNVRGNQSEWDSTVATFSLNVGAALLSTPYAFSQIGLAAIPLLCFFTFCSGYTSHLMAWALESQKSVADKAEIPPQSRDWTFLVHVGFGANAKRVLLVLLIVELWGYVISYTVVAAVHMHILCPALSERMGVLVSTVVTTCLCFVPPHILTKASVACNGVFVMLCMMFVATGLMLPEKAPSSDFFIVDSSKILGLAGILVFNSASHACYPSIMQSMEEPARYPRSTRTSYTAQLLFYMAVCVPAYFCFGSSLQQSLVGNIGLDRNLNPLPGLAWMGTVAAAGMVFKISAMQPFVLTPLVQTLEGILPASSRLVLGPMVLLLSSLCSALFADKMALLINLIGSVLCMNIAFVMPTACYWRLAGSASAFPLKSVFVSLIAMGVTLAWLGLQKEVDGQS